MPRRTKRTGPAPESREDSVGIANLRINGATPDDTEMHERTDWSKVPSEFEFKIAYHTGHGKKRKRDETDPQMEVGPWGDELNVIYSVKPVDKWDDTKRYRKFTISSETFQVGDIVLVKGDNPVDEPAADEDPSIKNEILNNCWVAKVLEVRAGDEQHVYLRVYYMYQPEELPGGRRSYHGRNELVASNHMQIIDAMTVDSKVDVKKWDETNDDEELPPDQLFWRQTYNTQDNTLSELRKHCICDSPYNPDTLLVNCSNPSCRKWLHAACIAADAVKRAYEEHGLTHPDDDSNINSTPDTASAAKKRGRKPKSRKRDSGSTAPSETTNGAAQDQAGGRFKAEVQERDGDEGGNAKYKIVVTESLGDRKSSVYEEDVKCLFCKEKID